MSRQVTFDSNQDMVLVPAKTSGSVSGASYSSWTEDVDGNGDYHISVFMGDYGVHFRDLMAGNQAGLKAIMDDSDTASNKKDLVVKTAIQTNDYIV